MGALPLLFGAGAAGAAISATGAAGAAATGSTLGNVALGTMLAGTALQAVGQQQAGQAESDAARYNAQVLKGEAQASRASAAFDAARISEEGRRIAGRQRAIMGASGLASGGSFDVVQERSENATARDRIAAILAGETQARRQIGQARVLQSGRQYTRDMSRIGAASTLLTGASYAALQTRR